MSDNGWCDGCEIELSDKNGSLMDGRLRGTPHTCGKPVESVSPPAQEVRPPISEAAQEMISLFENREELEKLRADYTSKCAELERVKLERDEYGKNWVESINLASERLEQLVAVREQLKKAHEALEIAEPYVVGWSQANEDGWIEKKAAAVSRLHRLLRKRDTK
jgi:hypothetical protein